MASAWLLRIAGGFSLAVAVFQAAVCFSPYWSVYFGAPEEVAADPAVLIGAGLIAAVIFGVFGLYGFSGAGSIRPLPLLRFGLVAIGSMYALRGMLLIPQLTGPADRWSTPQMVAASLVSLLIGLLYLAGTLKGWSQLPRAATS